MSGVFKSRSVLVLGLAILALGAGLATASTPDGETPAEEVVCDVYSGAAFGLCNAYCEAMDCELLDDGDPETSPHASVNACLQVKDNFIRLTGEAALPCDCPTGAGQVGCACTEDEDCLLGLSCEEGMCVEDPNGGS